MSNVEATAIRLLSAYRPIDKEGGAMSILTEEERKDLVPRLKQGDQSVIEDLIRRLGPSFEAWLRARYEWLMPFVDDLLSETIIRIWNYREDYDPTLTYLEDWFFALARQIVINLTRASWHKARALEKSIQDESIHSYYTSEEERENCSLPSEAQQDLAVILGDLSPLDRTVLYASLRPDCSNWAAELSTELGLSANALRARKHRLIKKVKEELASKGHTVDFDKEDPQLES